MKTKTQILFFFLLSSLVFTSCSKPISIENLTVEGDTYLLEGEAFSGTAYFSNSSKNSNHAFSIISPFVFGNLFGDSIVMEIEDGRAHEMCSFKEGVFFLSNKFRYEGDDTYTHTKVYHVEKGIWKVRILLNEQRRKNGQYHGSTYTNRGNRCTVTNYKNGNTIDSKTYKQTLKLWGTKRALIEETKFDTTTNGLREVRKYYPKNGQLRAISEYKNGRVLNETFYSSNGVVIQKTTNGIQQKIVLDGIIEKPYGNGKEVETYDKGILKNRKTYYANGQLWEEEVMEAKGNTLVKKWYTNGVLAETFSMNDLGKFGEYKKWYDSGKKWEVANYEMGILLEQKKWYKDGKLATDFNRKKPRTRAKVDEEISDTADEIPEEIETDEAY